MAKKKNSARWYDNGTFDGVQLHWTLWGLGFAYESDGDLAFLVIMLGPVNLSWTFN